MPYERTRYAKPFLKDVILRIDFGSRVEPFMSALPQKIAHAALLKFPISEPKRARTQEITFGGAALEAKTEDSMQWIYHGRNREKTLTITPETFLITNRQYESFEKFREDLDHIINALFQDQPDLSVSRIGLRYINVLETPGDSPLTWGDYVNEDMLGIIDMHKDAQALSRAFHIVEFNYDGQHVKFQFGIANPDYPAPIRRRQFVLDIDSYFMGALIQDDVARCVDAAHVKIQTLFEESVTQKTRDLMAPVAAQ